MVRIELDDFGATDVWVTPSGTVHVDKMGEPVKIVFDELTRKLVLRIAELEGDPKRAAILAHLAAYDAPPLETDADGFICEMALQHGAEMLNDDGTVYAFTQEQLLAYTKANRVPARMAIDSAPMDGTFVILFGGTTGEDDYNNDGVEKTRPVVAKFDGEEWVYGYWDGSWYSSYQNPTHWAPV